MPALHALLAVSLTAGVVSFATPPAHAASAWTVAPSPSPFRPARTALAAVSCATPTSCFAVGRRFDPNEDEPGIVIERWNGSSWSTTVDNPMSLTNPHLVGVSCATPSSCVAVGEKSSAPIAKRWNGHLWKDIPPVDPGSSASLDAVDCPTATSCWAVGSYRSGSKTRALIERWNGTTWKVVAAAQLGSAVRMRFFGISCPSTTDCFAVGNHEEPGDQVGGVLIEHWDGHSWSVMGAPNPKFVKSQGLPVTPLLTSVSCPSAKSCMAVGYAPKSSLIERWNGSIWSIVKSPAFSDGTVAELRGVACAAANDCSAVGTRLAPIDEREGIPLRNSINEHWNGTAWKVVPKPAPVPTNTAFFEVGQLADLNAVSCPARTRCFAVGNSAMPERWNGTKWSLAPLSDKTSASGLADVSCPTPTTCLAVGSAAPLLDSGNRVLAERWNGAAWSVVPSATPTGKNVHADLSAIACVSATDCFAVGGYTKVPAGGSTDSVGGALIERWNGAKWSIVASPSPAPKLRRAVLRAVSCSSATDCNAVGDYTSISNQGGDVQHLLAMHWNGSVWSIVTIPGPATMLLSGISCPSATNCFAVGYTEEGLPVVNRWDGGQWTSASSPAPPANTAFGLDDVTCVSDTDCTIVGIRFSTSNFSGYKTLIERWNGTTWTIVSAPTPAGRTYPRLEAVACASASSCVGVGTFEEHPTTKISAPFILAWDGAAWSIATAAAVPGATTAVLSGVAPLGTGFAAVGASGGAFGSRTLVEQQS